MTKFLVSFASIFLAGTVAQSWGQNFQSIFSFPANGAQGSKPMAALTIGPDGGLYGTASEGGAEGSGTAFKFNTTTGEFTPLGNFVAADTGKVPVARLVNIGDGLLYGVTSTGTGTAGDPLGAAFKLDPAGGDTTAGGLTKIFALPGSGTTPMRPEALVSGEANVLHVLGSSPGGIWRVPLNGDTPTNVFNLPASGDDGIFPKSIIKGIDGNLYGVTQGIGYVGTTPGRRGTIFKVAPNGTGFVKLHDCALETGVAPLGAMVQGPDGTFYGTMSAGGTESDGVIFKITPSGEYNVLRNIADNSPTGGLLLASDGRLYGISESGGTRLYGSIFRVNTDGTGFQVLVNFENTNGANPEGGLVQAADGNLYGVTSRGGMNDKGTIFRVDLNLPVPEVNRRPIAISDQGFSSGSAVTVNVLANDFDPDEDALTVTVETQPLHGTTTVEFNGAITYSPMPGGGYNGFDEFTYKITDPDGLSAEATVTITDQAIQAPWQPGTYNGILNLDPALTLDSEIPQGQLAITIQPTGVFTGRLFTNGKRLLVVGAFDESGTAVAVVKLSKKKKALMFLAQGGGNSLLAVFLGQEQLSGFISPLAVPDSPVITSHTVLLEPVSGSVPVGYGFGAMRILPNGLVVVAGKLADGSTLSWGTTLVTNGTDISIPVFNMPVRGGYCSGTFVVTGVDTFQGELKWYRPPASKPRQPYPTGFSGVLVGAMGRYTKPGRGELAVDFGMDQAGTVAVSGPSISPQVSGTVTVQGTRLVPGGELKSFSISKSTGLFKGKMRVGSKSVSFRGAVLQPAKFGAGYFTFDKSAGMVLFDADAF